MELSQAQKQVIDTQNKSLLVSASAGSGKTFVVVQRIIEGIKQGADISRLLVLTFTNAAASELKERLISSLYNLKDEYLTQGDISNARRIAKQISRVPMADISTIHSFCLNIIRNNFYTLGIDPNITTLDATKATIMLNDSINEVVEEQYEERREEFLDLLDILGNEDNLINTIYMLYNAYRSVLENDKWLENVINIYSTEKGTDLSCTVFGQIVLSDVKNRLRILKLELEHIIELLDSLEDFESRKEMLKIILNNITEAITKTTYDDMYEQLPKLLNIPNLPSTKVIDIELKEQVKDVKNKVVEELKNIANIMYKNSEGIITELNNSLQYVSWYVNVIKLVDEKYTKAKREKCSIDFSDYEHLALQALKDETIKNKYKEKYQYIYIDEYQDTSNAQEAIIQKIAKDNNVIMVGDVKQSIYAFRNAKPELFTNKYEEFKDVEQAEESNAAKIILAQNFRSRKEVLDSVNDVFSVIMSKDFGGTRYEDKEALVYGNGYACSLEQDYMTEINIVEKDLEQDEEVSEMLELESKSATDIEIEAVYAANRIRQLIDNKFQVYDLKKKEYRDIQYKDIVVLLKTVEGKADKVSNIFAKYDIPCFADSKTGFYKSEEITLITNFLKVLDNPLEDISLASVMYSIIGKFTLDDLVTIRNNKISVPLYESLVKYNENIKEEILKEKIQKFLELLKKFQLYLKTYKVSDVILKLYNETGIYEALRIEKLGELKCANLDNFVQVIADFEKGENATSLYLLLKYLNVLKHKESAGDSPKLLGENENVVRIMTIHKSKGLEFPVVILMNTSAKYNEQDTKDKLQFDEVLGVGIDIFDKEKAVVYPSIIKQAIKAKTKKVLRSEALRLLYVAMTRAKEKIIIFGTVSSLDKYTSKMIEVKNKDISELIVAGHNSHLKCILQAALYNDENFRCIIHKANSIDESLFAENVNMDRNRDRLETLKQLTNKYDITHDTEKLNKLKKTFISNAQALDINKKYTVSELKGQETTLSELKPVMIEAKVTGTSYGTFIHSVIEYLDYNNMTNEQILNVIATVARSLNIEDKINHKRVVEDINKMYSTLCHYLLNAKSIKNELEFVLQDNLQEVSETMFEQPTLIQGVVDMYIVTKEGKHIIIDFKTDKVEDQAGLLDRYKIQLKVYKKAIEAAYDIKTDGVYIYSFVLQKLIEVK